MKTRYVFAVAAIFAATAAPAVACSPSTPEEVKECKASCNKNAQSYESCKSNCVIMYNNCTKGTHQQTQP